MPFLQNAFGTFAFSAADWALTAAAAFTVVPVLETVKWFARHGYAGRRISPTAEAQRAA